MTNEKDPKNAAKICFDSIGLDPELYRIGHTKASETPLFWFFTILKYFWIRPHCLHTLIYDKHFLIAPCTEVCILNFPPLLRTLSFHCLKYL